MRARAFAASASDLPTIRARLALILSAAFRFFSVTCGVDVFRGGESKKGLD